MRKSLTEKIPLKSNQTFFLVPLVHCAHAPIHGRKYVNFLVFSPVVQIRVSDKKGGKFGLCDFFVDFVVKLQYDQHEVNDKYKTQSWKTSEEFLKEMKHKTLKSKIRV